MDEVVGGNGLSSGSEKQLTQEQVNEIVGREKARAAERTRLELEAQHRAELERVRGEASQNANASGIDAEQIRKDLYSQFMDDLKRHRDESAREAQEAEIAELAQQYHLKVQKGSQLFDDYNEVMADFDASAFPNAAMAAAQMENTPEIMYELANNPSKLIEIDTLARTSPNLAKKQLEKLSKSIQGNLEAKQNNVSAPAPLSKLKSSSAGADSGKMTVADFKSQPWLRG